LVRRYQERVYATIYHMTANHEDANDLPRRASSRHISVAIVQGGSSFFTWLYRIAVNKTINFSSRGRTASHEP